MSHRRKARVPDVSGARSWSAGKINTALDRLDRINSAVTDEFIETGRGHERPSEYLVKGDPLSRRARAIYDAQSTLRAEIHARYGPGAPSRLPRGFGALR